MAQHLILTSLETEVYDTTHHCATVNSSVQAELMSRVSVHNQLKVVRDAEVEASIAIAFAAEQTFIQTLKDAFTDLISAASVVPAVVNLDPATLKADSALELSGIDAEALERQIAGMDTESLTDSAELQDALMAAQSSDSGSLFGSLSDLFDSLTGGGGIDADAASDLASEGAEGLAVNALDALLVSAVPAAALIPQDMRQAMIKTALSAAVSVSKSLAAAVASNVTSLMSSNLMDTIASGALSITELPDLLASNLSAVGAFISEQVAGGIAGVPCSLPGTTELFTNESLGTSCLFNIIESYADTPGCSMSVLDKLMEQASGTCPFDIAAVTDMIANSPLTMENLEVFNAINGSYMEGSISLIEDPITGNIGPSGIAVIGGVCSPDPELLDSCGQLGTALLQSPTIVTNEMQYAESLQKVHPVTQEVSEAILNNAKNMTVYDQLTATGDHLARTCIGADMQNKLTSVSTVINTQNRSTFRRAAIRSRQRAPRGGIGYNTSDLVGMASTSDVRNKHNCYGLMPFKIG